MEKELVEKILKEISYIYDDLQDLYFSCENVYDKDTVEDVSRRVYWLFVTFNNYKKETLNDSAINRSK